MSRSEGYFGNWAVNFAEVTCPSALTTTTGLKPDYASAGISSPPLPAKGLADNGTPGDTSTMQARHPFPLAWGAAVSHHSPVMHRARDLSNTGSHIAVSPPSLVQAQGCNCLTPVSLPHPVYVLIVAQLFPLPRIQKLPDPGLAPSSRTAASPHAQSLTT